MGQHFLKSKKALLDIVNSADLEPEDVVLEVGPGKGVLTRELSERVSRVIAIEKDPRWVEELNKEFKGTNVEIIQGDILHFDHSKLPKEYKIVANLPYYLSSHFLKVFLESKNPPKSMSLMFQLEVARRITARPPNMNLLGLSVQVFGKPRFVRKISRGDFKPQPNVDSAIIAIKDIGDEFFVKNNIDKKRFFKLAKKAFGQKRKKLSNTIGVGSEKRPQDVTLDEWAEFLKD